MVLKHFQSSLKSEKSGQFTQFSLDRYRHVFRHLQNKKVHKVTIKDNLRQKTVIYISPDLFFTTDGRDSFSVQSKAKQTTEAVIAST